MYTYQLLDCVECELKVGSNINLMFDRTKLIKKLEIEAKLFLWFCLFLFLHIRPETVERWQFDFGQQQKKIISQPNTEKSVKIQITTKSNEFPYCKGL